MNAPLRPAWLTRRDDDPPCAPELHATEPPPAPFIERHLWHSRFGTIVVEVHDGQIYVNGDWVRPADPEGA